MITFNVRENEWGNQVADVMFNDTKIAQIVGDDNGHNWCNLEVMLSGALADVTAMAWYDGMKYLNKSIRGNSIALNFELHLSEEFDD